jgi:hypothetical protein
MQTINHRLGTYNLQTNRIKMLNDVVQNPYNTDYIVHGYKDPEYPENVDEAFNIIVAEQPDKYDTVTTVVLFSCTP